MISETMFKAYDVRAIYGEELTEEAAYAIGRAFGQYLGGRTVAIGRDNRASSPTLFREVSRGVCDAGLDVIDLGIVSTPMVYYASTHLDVDGVISITASHNPKEYNGLKFCRKNAESIGLDTGLKEIQKIALSDDFHEPSKIGVIRTENIKDEYATFLASFANLGSTHFSLVADVANAVGSLELDVFRKLSLNISLYPLFEELDSDFPNHEANPHKKETLHDLQASVKAKQADIGIAYDGDADRIGIVDERGSIVPADVLFAIIAPEILKKYPGSTLLYDLRSTKALPEQIEKLGGIPKESPVGGPKIKKIMRAEDAAAAAEISGHFIYKDTSYADSSTLTVILLLNALTRSGKRLSELVSDIPRFAYSGELNFTVTNAGDVLAHLSDFYTGGVVSTLDGLKITYPEWWFSVRASNTEPVIRVVVEADTENILSQKLGELRAQIGTFTQ